MSKKNAGLAVTDLVTPAPMRYVVQKRFKYGEGYLEPGAEFIPGRGRYDAQLAAGKGGFVSVEDARVPNRATRQRVRKEGQDGH